MKKILTMLLTFALVVSLVAGFALSANAEEASYLQEFYQYKDDVCDSFEVPTEGVEATVNGAKVKSDGFQFQNGWTFEYLDYNDDNAFKPLTAFLDASEETWFYNGWDKGYVVDEECAISNNDSTSYCIVAGTGQRIHPGKYAGIVITFIAPATGVISFDASAYMYQAGAEESAGRGGAKFEIFINETKKWPEGTDAIAYSDTCSKNEPFEISCSSFKITKGDKLRFVLSTSKMGDNGNKGVFFADYPVVTYHEADVPIGDPNGTPPTNFMTERVSKDSSDVQLSWDAARNAVGYNIYVKGPDDAEAKKINETPITEYTYRVTGLKAKTAYEFSVTTVTANGESVPTDVQTFITAGDPDKVTDPGNSSETNTDVSGNETSEPVSETGTDTGSAPAEKGGFPLWAVFVLAGVVLAVVAAVVIFLVVKKKKVQ